MELGAIVALTDAGKHASRLPRPTFNLMMGDLDKYGARGTGEYLFPETGGTPLRYYKGSLAESWDVTADRIIFHIRPGVLWAAYGKEHVMEVR
ncbi:unnamed protein product, partial [marine sediment metagenome]